MDPEGEAHMVSRREDEFLGVSEKKKKMSEREIFDG